MRSTNLGMRGFDPGRRRGVAVGGWSPSLCAFAGCLVSSLWLHDLFGGISRRTSPACRATIWRHGFHLSTVSS
jgi:hypothetical protein